VGSSTRGYYDAFIAVVIREMTVADIPAGLGFCRASGWNQIDGDWRYFLTRAPHGALAAVENDQVIGTVATLPYGPFTWISMVLVHPAARRRGIGTMLLDRGLALIPDDVAARLDATPAGELLYRPRGFAPEYRLARWFLDPKRAAHGDRADRVASGFSRKTTVRRLDPADWPAIEPIDARAFGASRIALLRRLAVDAPEYAWIAEQDSQVQGYLFGRHGHLREHLGPLIADSTDSARALLDACLDAHPDRTVFLDAPDDQREWTSLLAERGFAIERPFLRMYRGRLDAAGQPSRIYAITGPEFG
jgi:ribosomal protein S18 acetylase RimI-like enzyme